MRSSIYTPGAGHTPPVLAGRDKLLRDWQLMLNDVDARGRVRARDTILVGPRGVGKTAALSACAELARDQGVEVVNLQAVVGQTGLVDSLLQRAQVRIDADVGPWRRTRAAFERLSSVNLSVGGFGAGIATRDQPTTPAAQADAGSLAQALAELAESVREDAPQGGVLVTVDEMQVASAQDLALLAATLHRLNVDHAQARVMFAGTGLPFTAETLRQAGVTHPDRLFVVEHIPLALSAADARYAIVEPAQKAGVTWDPEAVERVVTVSNGYPAHLQFFADEAWIAAPGPSSISLEDVEVSLIDAATRLDQRTLGPRFDRLTDRQMEFLAAVALHGGSGPISVIANTLGRSVTELSWLRDALIQEGDIYVPRRGHVALAVPLFARYIINRYPDESPDCVLTLEHMRANAQLPPSLQ